MAAAAVVSGTPVPLAWVGRQIVVAPDGRPVPVDHLIPAHGVPTRQGNGALCSDSSAYYIYVEKRNRVLVELHPVQSGENETVRKLGEATQVVFKHYAAVEILVDYGKYGYVCEGHIWHNPASESQKSHVTAVKKRVTMEYDKANESVCTIL